MPKLNLLLMGVLTAAVVAGAGFLVLRAPSSEEKASVRVEKLLRKLADPDSDTRREGEDEFRRMGQAALAPLLKASTSADRVLAERAAKLLPEFQPPAPRMPGPPERPGSLMGGLQPDEASFEILCAGAPEKAQRTGAYLVQIANAGKTPVLVALPPEKSPWHAAWFEIEDDRGRLTRVDAEPIQPPDPRGSVVVVGPGSCGGLYWGWKSLRETLLKPEIRSVRFVYDASDPLYRATAEKFGGGALLPPVKMASKTFQLTEVR
ncbi:MAG TPA: hypothetical protein VKU80_02585 [Planctomycetota bacterium]|nr:hypothetical protein [Planctomycetota bacterium]